MNIAILCQSIKLNVQCLLIHYLYLLKIDSMLSINKNNKNVINLIIDK